MKNDPNQKEVDPLIIIIPRTSQPQARAAGASLHPAATIATPVTASRALSVSGFGSHRRPSRSRGRSRRKRKTEARTGATTMHPALPSIWRVLPCTFLGVVVWARAWDVGHLLEAIYAIRMRAQSGASGPGAAHAAGAGGDPAVPPISVRNALLCLKVNTHHSVLCKKHPRTNAHIIHRLGCCGSGGRWRACGRGDS